MPLPGRLRKTPRIALHRAGDYEQLPRTTMELLVRAPLDKEERSKMNGMRYLHRVCLNLAVKTG
jgi:hypothetical protein